MANVINLDEVLSTQQTLTYKGKEYTFDFSDATEKAAQDAWVKANAYVKQLNDDTKNADIDSKPTADQVKFVHDALAENHKIVMAFFVQTIGKEKADQLYADLNHSTSGLLFVLGLVKRLAEKSIQDAREAEYPEFDGNEDND